MNMQSASSILSNLLSNVYGSWVDKIKHYVCIVIVRDNNMKNKKYHNIGHDMIEII
jgi:hypothetical protein